MLCLLRRNPLSFSVNNVVLSYLRFPSNQIPKPAESSVITICYFSSATSTSDQKPSDKLSDSESIFSLLGRYGFSDAQIKSIVRRKPWFSTCNTEKIIKPKLDYFLAFGYSPDELLNLVSSNPHVLCGSLENRIAPNLNLLETMLGSKELVKRVISRSNWILSGNFDKTVKPNMKTLKENGVPASKVAQLLALYPGALTMKNARITKTVKKLKELGMNPILTTFIEGINVMVKLRQETWESKLALYRSFGWSEKDTLLAFAKNPLCMNKSEDKVKNVMDFFNKKLRLDPSFLMLYPVFFCYSLEKRIIPRCAVVNLLYSKGSFHKIPGIYYLLSMSEKKFKEKFVDEFAKELPEVLEAFHGKLQFTVFEFMDKKKQSEANTINEA